jgi:hypothetical protein
MASVIYTHFKAKSAKGLIDLDADDIRAILVKTTTTVDTEPDTEFISGFTTLAECDAASYARVALTGETVNTDTGNDRAEFTASNIVWAALGAGNTLQGVLLYKHVTNDTDSMPIAFIEFSSNFVTNGGGLTVAPNSEGFLQLT